MEHPRIVNVIPTDLEGNLWEDHPDPTGLHDPVFYSMIWDDGYVIDPKKIFKSHLSGETQWHKKIGETDLFCVNETKEDLRLAIRAMVEIKRLYPDAKVLVYQEGRNGEFQDSPIHDEWVNAVRKYADGFLVFNSTQIDYYRMIFDVPTFVLRGPVFLGPVESTVSQDAPVLLGNLQMSQRHNTYLEAAFAKKCKRKAISLNNNLRKTHHGTPPMESCLNAVGVQWVSYPWLLLRDLVSVARECFCAIKMDSAISFGRFQAEMALAGCPCIGQSRLDSQALLWPKLATDEYTLGAEMDQFVQLIDEERESMVKQARQGLERWFSRKKCQDDMLNIWRKIQ